MSFFVIKTILKTYNNFIKLIKFLINKLIYNIFKLYASIVIILHDHLYDTCIYNGFKNAVLLLSIMTKSFDHHCVIYYIFIVFGGSLRCGSTSGIRRACHQRSNHHHALKNHSIVPFRTLFSYSLSIEMSRSKISEKYGVRLACAFLAAYIVVDVPPRLPAISGRARWVMCCTAPLPPPPLPSV